MDLDGVYRRERRGDAVHGVPRAAVRAEARLYVLPRALPAGIHPVWDGADAPRAHCFSRRAGVWGRSAPADRAGHFATDVSRQGTGNGHGALRDGRHARSRHRSDARRLDRRQLRLAVDLLHQRADRHPGPRHGVGLRPRGRGDRREEPQPRSGAENEHRLVGHRAAHRRAMRAAVLPRGGAARRLVRVDVDHHLVLGGTGLHRGLCRTRADVRSASRQHSPLQGHGVPVGDAHRHAEFRAADGDNVPAAALHADTARLLGDETQASR